MSFSGFKRKAEADCCGPHHDRQLPAATAARGKFDLLGLASDFCNSVPTSDSFFLASALMLLLLVAKSCRSFTICAGKCCSQAPKTKPAAAQRVPSRANSLTGSH